MSQYLSVCAIYRDEAPYLREWIEFHRLVGAERFFLYNNLSEDEHREVLAPYVEDGTVVLRDWPTFPGQLQAYADCLENHRHDSRWIAFIDLDEFLFSPTGEPVAQLLKEYEQWAAVMVGRLIFSTSGHVTRPPGLVIENYVRRIKWSINAGGKSIVDPTRAKAPLNSHWFSFDDDAVVVYDTKQPLKATDRKKWGYSRLRINHYYTRSEEEAKKKFRSLMATGRERKDAPPNLEQWTRRLRQEEQEITERDDAILPYAPALEQALRRMEERAPSSAASTRRTSG
jgi:hypothetical protein